MSWVPGACYGRFLKARHLAGKSQKVLEVKLDAINSSESARSASAHQKGLESFSGLKMFQGTFCIFLYRFVIQSCKTVWPRASSDPHEDSKFAIHPVAAQRHHTTNRITSNLDSQVHIISHDTSVLPTFGVKVWRKLAHPMAVKRTSPADISCSPVGWKSIEEMAPALREVNQVNHWILRSRLFPLRDMFIIVDFKLSFHVPWNYRNRRYIRYIRYSINGTVTVWIGRRSSLRNPSNTRLPPWAS